MSNENQECADAIYERLVSLKVDRNVAQLIALMNLNHLELAQEVDYLRAKLLERDHE